MGIIIDGIDFEELDAEKYWSFPKAQLNKAKEETKNMIFSNDYLGARKMDGAYMRLIKDMDGNIKLQSRTESVNGGYPDKYEWVPQIHDFARALPNGTCLLGEIYFPNNEGSRHVTTIMGCLKDKALERQDKGEKLHYYIFDIWAWAGQSYMNTTAEVRFSEVSALNNNSLMQFEYVEYAQYYYGSELWDELARVRSIGGEGIVITKSNSIPSPGKRTARKTLKVKKEIDSPIDCYLTGHYKIATKEYKGGYVEDWQYWYNNRTQTKEFGFFYQDYHHGGDIEPVTKAWWNGWASAIEIGVVDNGKEISLGWVSGITDEVKKGIVEENSKWAHRVVVVNAMELDKDNMTLRHGKILEWRASDDKKWDECTIDQIV